jgi:hypothetical protein
MIREMVCDMIWIKWLKAARCIGLISEYWHSYRPHKVRVILCTNGDDIMIYTY